MSVIPRNGKVAVIGAGISGLSFSYFLLKLRPDVKISIFEANKTAGGWIKTEKLIDRTENSPILLEKGPRTLRGVSDGTLLIVDMLKQLQYGDQVEVMKSSSIANRKWILDPSNKLIQVPNSVGLFVKFMLSDVSEGVIASVFNEPFQKKSETDKDESVRSFILRRFGSPALADNVVSAIMHGIYSGNVSKLSVRATLPSLLQIEKEHGSIIKGMVLKMREKRPETPKLAGPLVQYELLISPDSNLENLSVSLKKFPIMRLHDGLEVFPRAMAEYLQKQENVDIRYSSGVTELELSEGTVSTEETSEKFDHVRFTLSTNVLRKLVRNQNQRLHGLLGEFEHTTIFLVNVFSKKGGLIPKNCNGFGFLVPVRNKNPESLLGVIYDSDTELDAERFFDGSTMAKVPYQKITLMMGGHFFSSRGVPSNGVNVRAAKQVLENILSVKLSDYNVIIRNEATESDKAVDLKDDDLLISYNLHHDCIPQYNVGYMEKVGEMTRLVAGASRGIVSLGGTSLGKLGVPDCVMGGLEGALELK